jgi:hypothetical protein
VLNGSLSRHSRAMPFVFQLDTFSTPNLTHSSASPTNMGSILVVVTGGGNLDSLAQR